MFILNKKLSAAALKLLKLHVRKPLTSL